MTVALKRVADTDMFRQDYAAHAGALPGAGLPWLAARRGKAIQAFGKTGIPTRRVEAWKFTDLSAVLDETLAPAPRVSAVVAPSAFAGMDGTRVRLVNGYVQQADAADGIESVDLAILDARTPGWVNERLGVMASGADQPLGAASLALMRGGVAIRVRGNPAKPLLLEFASPAGRAETVAHARVLIVVESGASLRLIESHTGANEKALNNIGMEIVLGANAKLDHVRLQDEGASALHITSLGLSLVRDAEYRALYVAAGAEISRIDANIALSEPGARAEVRNVAVVAGGIADTTTVMDHASPHTTSRQLFKSVVGGRGRSVNQGRVRVAEGAVKSDSHQLFKAMLLSPRAEADAKPELEIFADDVVCGHGTAIGALDEDALFYLRSRGIPDAEARGLLTRAFLAEAIEGFADEVIAAALWQRLDAALAAAERAAP